MADREGNILRPPGFVQVAEVVPVEILASYSGLLQKGAALASGKGVLRAGLALKKGTAGEAKLLVPALKADSASVVGFLRDAVDTTDGVHEAGVVLAGVLKAGLISYSDTAVDARTVSDGALNSNTTVGSATAAFTAEDVGRTIAGTGIPAGATIASVTNATTVVISAAATATATGVTLTIGPWKGLATATLDTLATALGGKYLAVHGYFKF